MVLELCKGDSDLEGIVLQILDGADSDTGAMQMGLPLMPEDAIEGYRLLKPLGAGGMGVVYLAERQDQYRQQVAIKCLRSEFASAEEVARFKIERQILAKLNHDHIAKILDGGLTTKGTPYFVMEYVVGESIVSYANSHQLQIHQRLELFQQVCQAVSFAHQHAIIHRDLKPDNILVDKQGHVKLLDFGIAKFLDPHDPVFGEMTRIETRAGSSIMTPQYASPEQHRGEPAVIASDVYTLGLLLYELLTGVPVFDFQDKTAGEIAEIIQRRIPEKPSTCESLMDGDLVRLIYGQHPRRIQQKISGDLDCIVLMALRKDPQRRYSSVADFSKDVRAFTAGQPVSAHPEKWLYLLKKIVLRNKVKMGFAAVVIFALLALSLGSLRVAKMTRTKNSQISYERDQAQAISQLLLNILKESHPLVQKTNPTIRDVLARAGKALESDGEMSPDAMNQLHLALIEVYQSYGFREEAEAFLEHALTHARTPLELARAKTLQANQLSELGNFPQALVLYDEAGQVFQQIAAEKPLLDLWIQKGALLVEDSQYQQAIEILQQALTFNAGRWPLKELVTWRGLANAYTQFWDFENAEAAVKRSEELIGIHLGDDAFAKLSLDMVRAQINIFDSNPSQALTDLNALIPRIIDLLGEDHQLVCDALHLKALSYEYLGNSDESLAMQLKSFECRKVAFGENHWSIGAGLHEIGKAYYLKKNYPKAVEYYRASLKILEKSSPANHETLATIHGTLGQTLSEAGHPEEGLEHTRMAYEICKSHPDLEVLFGGVAQAYGYSLIRSKRFEDALPILDEALAMVMKHLDQTQVTVGLVYFRMSQVYEGLSQPAKQREYLELAHDDYLQLFGPDHTYSKALLGMLTQLYQERGLTEELKALDQKIAAARKKAQATTTTEEVRN